MSYEKTFLVKVVNPDCCEHNNDEKNHSHKHCFVAVRLFIKVELSSSDEARWVARPGCLHDGRSIRKQSASCLHTWDV